MISYLMVPYMLISSCRILSCMLYDNDEGGHGDHGFDVDDDGDGDHCCTIRVKVGV